VGKTSGAGVLVGKDMTGPVGVASGARVLTILGVLVGVGVIRLPKEPQASTGTIKIIKTPCNNNQDFLIKNEIPRQDIVPGHYSIS
jgi:hypothetical protein